MSLYQFLGFAVQHTLKGITRPVNEELSPRFPLLNHDYVLSRGCFPFRIPGIKPGAAESVFLYLPVFLKDELKVKPLVPVKPLLDGFPVGFLLDRSSAVAAW